MTQQPPIAEGLQQVMGASATQTGLSQAEPEVSALRASIPSAEAALQSLGGRATAMDVCDRLTCSHCGFGLSTSAAQRLVQSATDRGTIIIERDWTLRLAASAIAKGDAK